MTRTTRRTSHALAAVACACVGGVGRPAIAEPPAVSLSLEAGSEYDSNPLRLELVGDNELQVTGSPLFRVGARSRVSWRPREGHRLGVRAFAGAKWFTDEPARDENVAILQANARYDVAVARRQALISVRFDNYQADGFDLGGGGLDTRTFSSRDGSLAVTLVGPDAHRATAHVGVRVFRYNPDADFDWIGDHYGVDYSTTLWSEEETDIDVDVALDDEVGPASVDIRAGYRLERRDFAGNAFANGCGADPSPAPECFVPTSLGRADLQHSAYAEVAYTGQRLYSARYEVQVADSNSFGQSLVRHRWEVAVTSELVWDVYVTARGFVRYNVFLDPLLLARDVQNNTFVSIDDENRNGLVLHATRDIGDDWMAEARYSLYSNEFASRDVSFRRQTAYAGLVYRFSL